LSNPYCFLVASCSAPTTAEGKYNSILDVYRHLIKEEGYAGLMKGFRPAMARAFPANAACFTAMELSRSSLDFLD
jgi:solute carrier family 25 carnitine/acylcarnitine transporter 20/29